MKTEIKFKENVQFEGRNGYFKSIGLKVIENHKEGLIELYPITSKGKTGRCLIEIPKENLQELWKMIK